MAALSSSNWRARATTAPPLKALPAAESVLSRQVRWPEEERQYRDKQRQFRRRYEEGQDVNRVASEATRIYVGNMPYIASKSDIEKLFDETEFEVANIDISIDCFTLRNPSYCFVDLNTSEEARKAIHILSGTNFQGRPLKVRPCVQERHQPDRYRADGLLNDRWSSSHSQESDTSSGRALNTSTTNETLAPIRENRRMYIGNLPKPLDGHTSDLEIRDLFRDFRVEAVSRVLCLSEEVHGSKYYTFVDLYTPEDAANAIEKLDGIKMWGTELAVNMATGRPKKALKALSRQNQELFSA